MKVLFETNLPSPYRVDFFCELGKLCELTVLYERNKDESRDDKWMPKISEIESYQHVFLQGLKWKEAQAFCPVIVKYLDPKQYDIIVLGGYSTPTQMLAIEYMSLKKIPFVLSSDGGLIRNDRCFQGRVKRHYISKASAWLSTGQATSEYLCYYGAKRDNIYAYPFTSVSRADVLEKIVSKEEKHVIRKQLGMNEKKIALSVGQFIPRKGYDILLNALGKFSENKDTGVYIIGGKATDEYIALQTKYKLENVHFVDFKTKEELAMYYKAADWFVLPTREDIWGLVVNEAMAYGLPVITTNKCVAGMEMIRNGENGQIIELNEKNIYEAMKKYETLDDISAYGIRALETAKKYTIEEMALRHVNIFKRIYNEK